mmetsp:Transcript_13053/g.22024  ORF Transcript_13053/g.22024 Transcript_13053/m.22024 type:complete len:163 (-) Transcript_13053:358-846(-)
MKLAVLLASMLASLASAEVDIQIQGQEAPLLNVEQFDLMVLDKETSTVKTDKPWFIKFFAPWCGHCKKLAPVWTELYQRNMEELNVARVDCTQSESKPLCEQFNVRGYPSLLFFKGDKIFKYKFKRSIEAMEDFVLNEGYLKQTSEEAEQRIPKRVEGMEKF